MDGQCITFITDYGYEAGFVGTLHAVSCRIAPQARLIDLDHSIPAGDVRLGALRLERLARYLPPGVHVGVVDPGVGGPRRPVALQAGEHRFVGPDNGLLVWAAEACGGIAAAVVLDDGAFMLPDRAGTFDGRDVFAPVAAHLAAGRELAEVGSAVDPASLVQLVRPAYRLRVDGSLELEVLQVDGFGNVQLGAGRQALDDLDLKAPARAVLAFGGREVLAKVGSTFADVAPGDGVLLIDSDRQLAYSVNRGRADETLRLAPGAWVVLRREAASEQPSG